MEKTNTKTRTSKCHTHNLQCAEYTRWHNCAWHRRVYSVHYKINGKNANDVNRENEMHAHTK